MRLPLFPALLSLTALCAPAGQAQTLIQILQDELQRNFTGLKKAEPAPYYMAYSVTEQESDIISAVSGVLQGKNKSRTRSLDVTVRVGSPKLDNYHIVPGQSPRFTSGSALPIEDVPAAIRQRLWAETDRTYRLGAQRLIEIKSNAQVKVAEQDQSEDFSTEAPSVADQPVQPLKFNEEEWSQRLRKWSARLSSNPSILNGQIALVLRRETKYMVSTEGTRLQHGRTFAGLSVSALGKASDGMDLAVFENFQASEPGRLVKPEAVDAMIDDLSARLVKLLHAPIVEPFIGPAILSGSASGVFFHEIFGHRVEGHRQRDEGEGQTFTKSVGSSVLPNFLSVVFDPTRKTLGAADLNGYYAFDDEGVKARPVTVVENGVLKTFLMSRAPVKGFEHSNGHGRRQSGAEVVSRQSNLIVESRKQVSNAKLRELLIAEIKRQNKPYGLYFEQVSSGFTLTQRRGLQAFTVIPLLVYRVFPDGKPDELVRGADIVGTPLSSFAKILATSDRQDVFNGYCGAESGQVPVSAISPALLVSEIEIQKKDHAQDRPPLLPRPATAGAGQ
ncbi:MAG: metallopeptidase TldD-related protein [Acidobacteriota bacterium]|nr:metallopeptidase TldD-related protein [Acidobacteriota bacterium]